MLPLRPFGSTGLMISPLALGTVKFGRDKALKVAPFTIPSDREASDLLGFAADLGLNLLDTAPAYGASEERLGRLIAGQRNRWMICTKVGEEFDNDTGASRFDFSPEHITHSVERSLLRLGVEALDIVLVHSDGNDEALIERGVLQTLEMLKTEGKIRAIGMSTKTIAGGLRAAIEADCVMVTYNLDQSDDLPVIEQAGALKHGVLIKKPLGSGRLAAGDGQRTLKDSFRHIFTHPAVGAAVVGTINPQHLSENVQACAEALNQMSR